MGKQQSVMLEEAAAVIKNRTLRLPEVTMDLDQVYREVLAEDITAANNQPPFPRSPLDGYAVRSEDSKGASKETPVRLNVTDKFMAGDYRETMVHTGEAVRIMTGAVIPVGADTVIRQEDTDYGEKTVQIYEEQQAYRNYCSLGEDYKKGDILLTAGTVLDFTAIAVLASNGTAAVKVYRKPEIAVIATGDELVEPGRELPKGKIYNANLYLLKARLQELGISCKTISVKDNTETVKREILTQIRTADAVITTGGVSVGEKDILNDVLPELGADILFEGVRVKPGSPAKFAFVEGKPLLALSGNPFAAAVTFELLARPLIGALSGTSETECEKNTAILENTFTRKALQTRFIRGCYKNGIVRIPEDHSSGQLRSMLGCNCLVEIPPQKEFIEKENEVTVWRL